MSSASRSHAEEVFEGRGVAIHISPEGIAMTVGGQIPQDEQFRFAEYSQVAAAQVSGGARASLIVTFSDGRPAWVVPRMRRAHAEWAKWALDERARHAVAMKSPAFAGPLTVKELQGEVAAMAQLVPPPAPDITDLLLTQAVLHLASDLHLLPTSDQVAVRWRVDGLLTDVCALDAGVGERVGACLKLMAGLATYRHDLPQEGRASLQVTGGVELRITALPSLHGEALTVRIFDPGRGIIPLEDLGFEEEDLAQYRRAIAATDGMVILTGPSGAGKTTTLYSSLLAHLAAAEATCAYATVEQPVEYDLEFASQTDVDPDSGLTFARALSTVLRQDPNVIMVGEIRDPETAEIAVRAGMTGHLVFTTLHAGSSAAVFPRLAELDVAPYLSTSAVRCLVAQRLLRKLCACATESAPEPATLAALGLSAAEVEGWQAKRPVGCADCGSTGYSGRTAVIQVTPVGDAVREAAMRQASAPEVEATLRDLKIPSLRELALRKVQRGQTSLEEVARVMGQLP